MCNVFNAGLPGCHCIWFRTEIVFFQQGKSRRQNVVVSVIFSILHIHGAFNQQVESMLVRVDVPNSKGFWIKLQLNEMFLQNQHVHAGSSSIFSYLVIFFLFHCQFRVGSSFLFLVGGQPNGQSEESPPSRFLEKYWFFPGCVVSQHLTVEFIIVIFRRNVRWVINAKYAWTTLWGMISLIVKEDP